MMFWEAVVLVVCIALFRPGSRIVEATMLGQMKSLLPNARRKAATAPDQKTDDEALGALAEEKTSILHDVLHSGKNARFVVEALPQLASGEPLDDKKLLLEHGVSLLQSLPLNSGLSAKVSDGFIQMLYNDLPHPSTTTAGPTTKYRRHDGGGNNIWNPEMGKAGTPYARNVPPMKPKGRNLPDPELVWEHLLKRPQGTFKEHPSGLNRLFFSFATIVIHECFQTNRKDQWINNTSSYVDLSTLYGNNEEEQLRVRTYTNGTIWPDSIASDRIMLMPPGVVALLVLFSRNHNKIAKDLITVNEEGKYKDWETLNEKDQKWYVAAKPLSGPGNSTNINQARQRHLPARTQHQRRLLRICGSEGLCSSHSQHAASRFDLVTRPGQRDQEHGSAARARHW